MRKAPCHEWDCGMSRVGLRNVHEWDCGMSRVGLEPASAKACDAEQPPHECGWRVWLKLTWLRVRGVQIPLVTFRNPTRGVQIPLVTFRNPTRGVQIPLVRPPCMGLAPAARCYRHHPSGPHTASAACRSHLAASRLGCAPHRAAWRLAPAAEPFASPSTTAP